LVAWTGALGELKEGTRRRGLYPNPVGAAGAKGVGNPEKIDRIPTWRQK
jgi:hypothetical protein